jgi:hypothetical protein
MIVRRQADMNATIQDRQIVANKTEEDKRIRVD